MGNRCFRGGALALSPVVSVALAVTLAVVVVLAATSALAAPLPRVRILATGGTIAGKASGTSEIGYDSGQVQAKDLIAAVPGIESLAQLDSEQIANVGSQDMNDQVWFALARRIGEIFAKNEADAIVVTHGTDTMEETAFFLEQVLPTDRPVVLVGSMRPSTAIGADGPANLYEAVEVAASPQARGRGVLVVLNDTIHESRDLTKGHTTAVHTFVSPNSGPAGYVDPASVRFLGPPPQGPRPRFPLPAAPPLPRVDVVYAHAGATADAVEASVKGGAKGIVLAGVGDGNAPGAMLDALAAAARKGIVVVRSSRVPAGFTNRNVEVNDDQLGFAASLDLNPQKARVLLQLLLASEVTDPGKVQAAFAAR